jgi:Tol biopolymer transport system component
VTITAPPEPPGPAPGVDQPPDGDAQEALIKEARRRARLRRVSYAAAAVAAGSIGLALWGAGHGGEGGTPRLGHGGRPAAAPATAPISPPARANGLLAIVDCTFGCDLAAVRADGSGRRLLTACVPAGGSCGFGGYAWSPDGKRLAFLSGHISGAGANTLSLFVINSDGTGKRLVARCGNCDPWQNPSWSPDSRRIVYAGCCSWAGSLFTVNTDEVIVGAQHRLAREGTAPAWSPAAGRIAYGSGGAVYSINPDGSEPARLAAVGGQVTDLAWSPDGTRIAFDTSDEIYVVRADGSHLRLLFHGPPGSGPGAPSWSPNGDRILFFNTPGTPGAFRGEVWIMNADGSGRRRIFHPRCCVGDWRPPIWSPDGKAIAVSGVDSAERVLVMDLQGKHRRTLARSAGTIAWQSLPKTRGRRTRASAGGATSAGP